VPYIASESRNPLDTPIDKLAELIIEKGKTGDEHKSYVRFAGSLKCAYLYLAKRVIELRFGQYRYATLALTRATLHDASDEFCRRFRHLSGQVSFKDGDYTRITFCKEYCKDPHIGTTDLMPELESLAKVIATESRKIDDINAFAGILNYSYSRLTLKVIDLLFGEVKGWMLSVVRHIFDSASREMYQIITGPYEDKAIKKNGDVDLYEKLSATRLRN
jgi:hypothetical protein